MNSQVADLVGDRDGGRASTPRSHPYPFPLPRITTAAKKPLTVEEADSFTSSCAGMTATERSQNPNAIALHTGGRADTPGLAAANMPFSAPSSPRVGRAGPAGSSDGDSKNSADSDNAGAANRLSGQTA